MIYKNKEKYGMIDMLVGLLLSGFFVTIWLIMKIPIIMIKLCLKLMFLPFKIIMFR